MLLIATIQPIIKNLVEEKKIIRMNGKRDVADEIFAYLEMNNDVKNWVVIDDLDLHNSIIEQNQIKTDPTVGLTLKDIEKAEEMLLRKS